MVEFIVTNEYDNKIGVGIAVPGFDGSKYPTSDKAWFTLNSDEADDLISKLLGARKELSVPPAFLEKKTISQDVWVRANTKEEFEIELDRFGLMKADVLKIIHGFDTSARNE